MKIRNVQLVTTTTAVGKGANDGIYPPGGLLTIAKALKTSFPELVVSIDDQHHKEIVINPEAELVGIQVASALCYKNSLAVAQQAKAQGKVVVLGGQHVTPLYQQIMQQRPFVDFAIRGKGETPLVKLVRALNGEMSYKDVPGLSWRQNQTVVHNPAQSPLDWNYDDFTPLPLSLLTSGVESYWQAFRDIIDPEVKAAFLLFTHFGCGFRQKRVDSAARRGLPVFTSEGSTPFCSFCSLDDPPLTRNPENILREIRTYLDWYNLPLGARIHLKCYGDNIGPQVALVESLAVAIEDCEWWKDYQFSWTFYCQSSYLTERLASLLKRIGTTHLYIGFDGANDEIQRQNGLGTNMKSHLRAVELCKQYGILIQAGSVVGLKDETPETLEEQYQFLLRLRNENVLERTNSAVLFGIPGTLVYYLLMAIAPELQDWDFGPTETIDQPTKLVRELWIQNFCPAVSLSLLEEYADKIDALSPGPHASMGYDSRMLKNQSKFNP